MTAPLQFEGVTKRFGRVLALDELTLELGPGEVLGLLGPNGAGKTTAIQLALGFLHATAGHGTLMGKPFGHAATRARVGYVPDAPVFFEGNAVDTLVLAARLSNRKPPERRRLEGLLEAVGLRDWKRDARKFSRGMQQRLGLAAALVHDPEVLILDEPASALDPPGVIEIRGLLRRLRAEGKSILFSSHQLAEVAELCDRVAFLNAGKLMHVNKLAELLRVPGQVEITVRGLPQNAVLRGRFAAFERNGGPPGVTRWVLPEEEQRRTIEQVWADGGELVSVRPAERSLQELFAEWTTVLPVREGER